MIREASDKRIAFIIGSMGKGGAERVVSILANSYARRGWNVDILTLLDGVVSYELDESICIKPLFSPNKSRAEQLPKWLASIRSYVKKCRPSCVISFFTRINILTILACLGLRQRIVISERTDPRKDGRSLFLKIGTFLLYPSAERIVFQTKWAQSCFRNSIQAKSLVIYNPIEVTHIASESKSKNVVAVGRLVEDKNHKILIKAFMRIAESYPDYKLFIYGEGKLRIELTSLVDQLNLEKRVFLPGNVNDIHRRIRDAEVFVLSSNREGLSNALLEAMMMSIPCVSTNCAGSNEIIINGYNGLLVNTNDEEQLFEAIMYIINNKENAEEIGRNGRLSVLHLSKEKIIREWQRLIEQ